MRISNIDPKNFHQVDFTQTAISRKYLVGNALFTGTLACVPWTAHWSSLVQGLGTQGCTSSRNLYLVSSVGVLTLRMCVPKHNCLALVIPKVPNPSKAFLSPRLPMVDARHCQPFIPRCVLLLSPLAQGLQQLLDTLQSFCVTNGLTISIPKTEVVVFGVGHQPRQWHVGSHRLKRSESFIYLGMLFHEDRDIKHAI